MKRGKAEERAQRGKKWRRCVGKLLTVEERKKKMCEDDSSGMRREDSEDEDPADALV